MSEKLDIFRVLAALDNKDRDFYDNLTSDERKVFSAFLTLKWASAVEGSADLQHYYLASINYYANKDLFNINKHPKLQWLLLTAASPAVGQQRHAWIGSKKKNKDSSNTVKKQLEKLFPNHKLDEITLLSQLITKRELDEYISQHGDS